MENIKNVLSLFDGCSGGQQALDRLNIKVDNYFASEIDKPAMKVTMANYPNTIQLGSVVDIDCSTLPKIDLLLGGSPCQSFSFAGKRKGMSTKSEIEILTLEHYLQLKSECYEFEGQSYLFWEYMRILNEVKPTYFLLENVEMGHKWEMILSKAIGVNGIHINSSLVSAQNRKRIYWTNIGMVRGGLFGDFESIIQQPKDKGILLKDVLESEVHEKYYLSEKAVNSLNNWAKNNKEKGNGFKVEYRDENQKSAILTTGSFKSSSTFIKIDKTGNVKNNQDKASCFTAGGHSAGNHSDMDLIIVHNTMPRSSTTGKGGTGPLSRNDGKTYSLCTGSTNAVEIKTLKIMDFYNNNIKEGNKSNTVTPHASRLDKSATNVLSLPNSRIRRLTPLECERLQTVKDNYTNHVSDSQRYKMLGNGWTISVITHILSYLHK
jgi:DNA-cytosine methyltransferase